MYNKAGVLFVIVQGLGLLYEIANQKNGQLQNKYGLALHVLNGSSDELIDAWPDGPHLMADQFLDWIYRDGLKPTWMPDEATL